MYFVCTVFICLKYFTIEKYNFAVLGFLGEFEKKDIVE